MPNIACLEGTHQASTGRRDRAPVHNPPREPPQRQTRSFLHKHARQRTDAPCLRSPAGARSALQRQPPLPAPATAAVAEACLSGLARHAARHARLMRTAARCDCFKPRRLWLDDHDGLAHSHGLAVLHQELDHLTANLGLQHKGSKASRDEAVLGEQHREHPCEWLAVGWLASATSLWSSCLVPVLHGSYDT